jgi:hypothetical protein
VGISFDDGRLTPPISAGFGPGPQFTLTAGVKANVHYAISVAPVDALGLPKETSASDVKTFIWTAPYEPAEVPWPARPLPPVVDFDSVGPGDTPPPFSPRVVAEVFYDSDGVAPNPRYPVGVRIGQLNRNGLPNDNALTDHTDEYLTYQSGGFNSGGTPADPNIGVFRSRGPSRLGQSLFPIVLYRQQMTNSLFPRVSGPVMQVSPLIERIPWTINPNLQVTIPDRLFAGYTTYDPIDQTYVYFLYLRDLQPVQLGARYRYFVVRFNAKREVQDIIPAGEVELPLN